MGNFRMLEIALLASMRMKIMKNMQKCYFLIMKNPTLAINQE